VPEAFFLPHMMCYGWGTWADAWARFEPSAERLWAQVRRLPWRERYRYQLEGGQNYLKMLQDLRHGNNSSWAIRWATALYLQGGLGLYPGQGYVRNIGFDGSGANTAAVDAFANFPLNDRVPALEHLPLEVNEAGRQAMNAFFRRTRQNVLPLWVTDFLYLYGPYKGLQALQKLKASAFS
jgi:hypothetical protein